LVGGRVGVVDHLVVAPNGIWVVATAPEPIGRVERRDQGDWFTPDPRLYVAGVDASPLLEQAVASFRAVDEAVAGGPLANVARFGVLCFVDAAPAWFAQPFTLADITVTWRRHLLEPMLGATVYGPPTRLELARFLADRFPPAD
jgi:hypothetical protein